MTTTAATSPSTARATGVDDAALAGLRRWNLALAILHAIQAVAILLLATSFSIDVTASFPTGPPGSEPQAPESLLAVAIAPVIAVFLLLAALDHGLSATVLRSTYERDLARGINRLRWIEYSVSATIMILLICAYSGIVGISALIAIAGANVAMILFGWLQEAENPPGRSQTTMRAFWFGTIAGLAPWIAISVNLVGATTVPGFVLGIFVSLLIFFSSFAVNQWLQYREIGPWRSYAFGERAYLVLSLVAKSALAWQLFAGSLAG